MLPAEPKRSFQSNMDSCAELLAEVIAVGDELTSGQRLDTNSQWLASQLSGLGVRVAFHSTVGDDLQLMTSVLQTAMSRADVIVVTGGLGPTKDDLTRQAIADAAGVELVLHEHVIEHIEKMFARFGRKMPDTNRVQAYFPESSEVIDNPEGTAPGIDFANRAADRASRCFALPGVPYEMKQMWSSHVQPALVEMLPQANTIHHHVLRCFGVGESQAESMLPDMMRRDRDPRVGITASMSTISFRISTRGSSKEDCLRRMEPTIREIRETMGNVVFGENEDTLHGLVARQLRERRYRVGFVDFEFGGRAAQLLQSATTLRHCNSDEDSHSIIAGNLALNGVAVHSWIENHDVIHPLHDAARKVRDQFESEIGIAISGLEPNGEDPRSGTFHVAIHHSGNNALRKFTHAGHSSLRDIRSAKHVLNFLRLYLLDPDN